MSLVAPFAHLVQSIGMGMTLPTLHSFLTVVTGWLFAPRRTVTAMLVAAGALESKHHSAFHRLFASARWSLDILGLSLFDLLAPWQDSDVVELSVDDTLARKRGLKVFGAGMHHDSMRSSRKQTVLTWGHSWVVLAVIVRLPCCPNRVLSLPLLFRLYLNHKASDRWRLPYRTRPELAVQMLHALCRRYPSQRFHLVADSA